MRQDAGALSQSMAAQVHGDVDLELEHQLCNLSVACAGNVDEARECRFDTAPRGSLVAPIPGKRDGLEATAIMPFKHPRQEMSDGMLAEVA